MKQLKILLVFISLFVWRWVSLDSPLPESWTPESKVRFTARVLERPEYTDSQTIIRKEIWYIPIKGYAEIIPGSQVTFTGKVEPKLLMNQVTRIVMVDPIFEVLAEKDGEQAYRISSVVVWLGGWREKWVRVLEKTLPEPMSSLAAGILLGVKGQMPYEFYQQLVSTGTLHIVAASGFNVMIVASVLMALASKLWKRGVAIGVGVVGIVIYVLLAGASASVVRAGIMGSLTLIAYYFGRPGEARRLLWVTAGLMLLFTPLYIVDIGFQLSVAATAGILYVEPCIRKLQSSVPCKNSEKQGTELKELGNKFLSE
jgi:ComEC/Rec2-related protein